MKTSIFSTVGKSFLLIALSTSSLLFSSCNDGEYPVVPPVIPEVVVTYGIGGVVTDIKNKPVAGVAVKLSGTAEATATTGTDGAFTFTKLAKKGAYTLALSKAEYSETTTAIELKNNLLSVAVVLPFAPVEVEAKAGEDTELVLKDPKTNVDNLEVTLVIPAGALEETKTISVTQVIDPVADAPASLIVLNYKPDGLKFETPCPISITNPLDEYSIANPQLQYLNTETNKWEVQKQAVTFADETYNTEINHFSSYKIDGYATRSAAIASTEKIAFESIDNLDGNKAVEVKDLPYAYQRGTTYVITPAEAAAAAGITNKNVIQLMESAFFALAELTEVNEVYGVNTTLPVGVRMDIAGEQAFSTVDHIFTFVKGGEKVSVTVTVKKAGAITITPSLYTKEHIGGAGN